MFFGNEVKILGSQGEKRAKNQARKIEGKKTKPKVDKLVVEKASWGRGRDCVLAHRQKAGGEGLAVFVCH